MVSAYVPVLDVYGIPRLTEVEMDIIRMSGGIGNQMFQYALYLKLVSLGREVKFDDVTEYKLDNARPIMLWVFGIDYPKADRQEVIRLTDSAMDMASRVRRKLLGRKSAEYHEKSMDFDAAVLEKENSYLCGCFQSERYFKDVEDKVREAFRFRRDRLPEGEKERMGEYERRIREAGAGAVSIHIRRGDYLASPEVYGGICTDAYYDGAVAYLREICPDASFFVFTNDSVWAEQWCRKKERPGRFTVIKGTTEATGYLDLMLMSKCRHHIIANSSFSWWGAWLADLQGKCVAAPAKWLNTYDCRDIYTSDMVRIDASGKVC